MILVSINVPIQKILETYFMIFVSISDHTKKSGKSVNDPGICAHIRKSGNLFYDHHINLPIQKSLETYLMILVSISGHIKKVWKLILRSSYLCP